MYIEILLSNDYGTLLTKIYIVRCKVSNVPKA